MLYLIPGVLTIAGFFLLVAALGSRVHKVEQAFGFAMTFMDFAQYPITIYPRTVRFVLLWVIPYAFVAFIPIAVAFDIPVKDVTINLWWLPVYGVLVFLVGMAAFRISLRRFETTGS